MKASKNYYGFNEVWTNQCYIYANVDGKVTRITSKAQLVFLTGEMDVEVTDPYYEHLLNSRSEPHVSFHPPMNNRVPKNGPRHYRGRCWNGQRGSRRPFRGQGYRGNNCNVY